jgi:hypothetical protein
MNGEPAEFWGEIYGRTSNDNGDKSVVPPAASLGPSAER